MMIENLLLAIVVPGGLKPVTETFRTVKDLGRWWS